ncbi:CBO0543 family protein [Aquibacillus saliphilus]|uniref:CBO0543 family protein n=1 Tax=Aquibacillus saliphilus TaxID=1909422 RepID=UPI001CEFD1B2
MKKEKTILYGLTLFGSVFLLFALNKRPRKDWLIVFLLKTVISVFFGNIVAANKWLEYPDRLLPNSFKGSVLFEYLLFPLICVYYNQTTYKSKLPGMIYQSFLYSIPMTIVEIFLEKKTQLINYKKWRWYYTLFSLSGTFLLVRGLIAIIRSWSKSEQVTNDQSWSENT